MKFITCVFVLAVNLLTTASFSQTKGEIEFVIKGNIKGLKDDSVILFIRHYDKAKNLQADTIVTTAKNDRFLLPGKTDGIHDASVVVGGIRSRRSFTFFIEKGTILANGSIDSLDNVAVTGTPENDVYTAYRKIENNIYSHIRVLQTRLKQAGENEKNKLTAEINAWRDSIRDGRVQFITTRPGSPAAAIYLYVLQDNIPVEQLESLYNNLSPTVKGVGFVRNIPEKIAARKRSAIGKMAPDFSSKDTSGNSVKLSDFRGKYVLLEFWANWCVPCRQQSPHLAKVYHEFKDKGFTILQYSVDEKNAESKWKDAIRKDQLTWTQISDLNGFESNVSRLYGVQPIPDNFLIDPDGRIIGRRLEGKELEEKLKSVLK